MPEESRSLINEDIHPQDSNTSSSIVRPATVEAVRGIITKNKKGKERENIAPLFEHVLITQGDLERLVAALP